jgi:hypothetical protein
MIKIKGNAENRRIGNRGTLTSFFANFSPQSERERQEIQYDLERSLQTQEGQRGKKEAYRTLSLIGALGISALIAGASYAILPLNVKAKSGQETIMFNQNGDLTVNLGYSPVTLSEDHPQYQRYLSKIE